MTIRMPNDEELYRRVDEVAHYLWDPIGISDVPEARDEYHAYLPELYSRTKIGKIDEIIEYMQWVVVDRMGMSFDSVKAKQSAEVMVAWKDAINERS